MGVLKSPFQLYGLCREHGGATVKAGQYGVYLHTFLASGTPMIRLVRAASFYGEDAVALRWRISE